MSAILSSNNNNIMTSSSKILPDAIAKCALHHYDHVLPNNIGGKPQKGREWTVYAAIVAVMSNNDAGRNDDDVNAWVVSCATGSKCTSVHSVVSTFPSESSFVTNDQNGNAKKGRQGDDEITQAYNGMVLKDSHAEVLARRGLLAVLWDEIKETLRGTKSILCSNDAAVDPDNDKSTSLLEVSSHKNKLGLMQFRLKRNVTLHMYVSDSPCGDATIYEVKKLKELDGDINGTQCGAHCSNPQFDTEMNFTGAKLILSGNDSVESDSNNLSSLSEIITMTNSTCPVNLNHTHQAISTIRLGREHTQQLGALRLKSSRSNIPSHLRSRSMSCSDKLVRWGIMGLQGSMLNAFIPDPICLTSVCVSKDRRSVNEGQSLALNRALRGRIINASAMLIRAGMCSNTTPPEGNIVSQYYDSSKSESDNRRMMLQHNCRKRSCDHVTSTRRPDLSKRARIEIESYVEPNPSNKTPSKQQSVNNSQAKKESSSGMSMNWYRTQRPTRKEATGNIEITVGATGLKRGKKPKCPHDVVKAASRLSRFSFIRQWKECLKISFDCTESKSSLTRELLGLSLSYAQTKQKLFDLGVSKKLSSVGLLSLWVRTSDEHDFTAF